MKKVDYLSKVGDKIQILGRTAERTRWGYRIITSRRYIDQSLKDMHMEKCNPVRTPGLQVTEKDLATEEQLRSVGRIVSTSDGADFSLRQDNDPMCNKAVKELARGMSSPTNIHLGTAETTDAILGEQTNKHLESLNQQPRKPKTMSSPATSHSDWGGLCENKKEHNWNCFQKRWMPR